MDVQKEFSRAAIGGLKKEEVQAYIDRLAAEQERRLSEKDAALNAANAQIKEYAVWVE